MKKSNFKYVVILHVLLLVYSFCDILSKSAGMETFLSLRFIVMYGLMICCLGVYAIGWQQAIKRLPLTFAFANKAITIVWGLIWGFFIFKEEITLGKVIGCFLVIAGVIVYSLSEGERDE